MTSFFSDLMNYQYFIQVVPTDVQMTSGFTYSTYQYSVSEHVRPIDHDSGSHGSPGLYFKYDFSALKVKVSQDREGLVTFLVRLCAGVGGLVATSQIVCGLLQAAINFYCCHSSASVAGRADRKGSATKTADLLMPADRASATREVPQPQVGQPPRQNSGIVTLQEVEKMIKK